MVKSAQAVTVLFATSSPATGAAADADSTPTGAIYVNGTVDAASVTVTNITTGLYKAAVTLPSLSAGDIVSLKVAATVGGVAGVAVAWQDVGDTLRLSDTLSANAVQISGDTTAADNLETMLDGTGGAVLSLGGLDIDATGAGVDGTGTAVKVQGDIGTTAFALTIGGHEGVYVDAAGRGVYMLTSGKGVEIDASDIGVLVTTSLEGIKVDSGGYSLALYTAETGSPIYVSPPGDDFSAYLIDSVADAVWDEALANRAVDTASTGGALNYIKGRVANLSPGSIAVQSPVLSSDSFEMIRGDSYNTTTDYDRSITFSVTTPLSIMTTAAEVYGYFVHGTNMIVQQPAVTNTDTNVYDIKFEFTNEQTVAMTSGTWDIKVWWNTEGTEADVTTLVSGTFSIVEPTYDGADGADGV